MGTSLSALDKDTSSGISMLHFTALVAFLVASAFAADISIERFDVNDVNDMKKLVDELGTQKCSPLNPADQSRGGLAALDSDILIDITVAYSQGKSVELCAPLDGNVEEDRWFDTWFNELGKWADQ